MRAHRSYRHEALLYDGTDGFLAALVPFLAEGVTAGQPTMVATSADRCDLLARELGADADRVDFVDMAELGGNPARIIPAWERFITAHADSGQPVRGVGEPVWPGRRQVELEECHLHEGLLNLAIAPDTPMWLICPYDTAALPAEVLTEVERTHPMVLASQSYRGSTAYGGAYHVGSIFGRRLPDPPESAACRAFDRDALASLPGLVTECATAHRVPPGKRVGLAEAVFDLAKDCVECGDGSGTLTMWCTDHAFCCQLDDRGVVLDPMTGRRVAASGSVNRGGLWTANERCDLVQLRSSGAGTSVRLHTWL